MLIKYQELNLRGSTLSLIRQANEIVSKYELQGYVLTLRQLYYQFVSRGFLANHQRNYDRLGKAVGKGRLAGLISWEAIVDRTRELQEIPHWSSPKSIVESAAATFQFDRWADQANRVEVWVEKQALIDIIARAAGAEGVDYYACKGYGSLSEYWGAAQRFNRYVEAGQAAHVIHLGDHDPSGCHMTEDLRERLATFQCPAQVHRIALNMDQVREYDPPPNFAKPTDSRTPAYVAEHGSTESWELDALEPAMLVSLIRDKIASLRDEAKYAARLEEEEEARAMLAAVVDNYPAVEQFVTGLAQ